MNFLVHRSDWRQWLDAEHTTMEYAGGERCWNGPERKTIVKLSCGEANKVISVEVRYFFLLQRISMLGGTKIFLLCRSPTSVSIL